MPHTKREISYQLHILAQLYLFTNKLYKSIGFVSRQWWPRSEYMDVPSDTGLHCPNLPEGPYFLMLHILWAFPNRKQSYDIWVQCRSRSAWPSGVILEGDLGEKVSLSWLSPYLELREKRKCIECIGITTSPRNPEIVAKLLPLWKL